MEIKKQGNSVHEEIKTSMCLMHCVVNDTLVDKVVCVCGSYSNIALSVVPFIVVSSLLLLSPLLCSLALCLCLFFSSPPPPFRSVCSMHNRGASIDQARRADS